MLSSVKTLFVLNSFPFVGEVIRAIPQLIARDKACPANCARVHAYYARVYNTESDRFTDKLVVQAAVPILSYTYGYFGNSASMND